MVFSTFWSAVNGLVLLRADFRVASAAINSASAALRLSDSSLAFSAFSSAVCGWVLRRVDLRDASAANPSAPATLCLSALAPSLSLFLSAARWILRSRSASSATFSAFCAYVNEFSQRRFASRAAATYFSFRNFMNNNHDIDLAINSYISKTVR